MTSSKNEGGGVRYFFKVIDWWSYDNTRTICGDSDYGYGCTIRITALVDATPPHPDVDGGGWGVGVGMAPGGGITLGGIISRLNSKGQFLIPYSSSVLIEVPGLKSACLTLQLATGYSTKSFTDCVPVIAPPVKCDLYGKNTINYGALLDSALNGAQASTNLTISCTGSASVAVKATRTNSYGVKLRDDDSLYSEVKVNGKDATNGVDVSVASSGATSINIASTLKVRGGCLPWRIFRVHRHNGIAKLKQW